MTLHQIVFYAFSALLLLAATLVITTRHPVRAIMFLILSFFASSVLWMLLQAEFLSLVLIFVYVGAVMTLFLFVVMMLNVASLPRPQGMRFYLPFGGLISAILAYLMFKVVGSRYFDLAQYPAAVKKQLI